MTDSMTVPSDVEHTASHWSPPPRGRLQGIIMVLAAIGVITIVLYIWKLPPFDAGLQQTDNAYVRGRTTVIAPQVSGYIVQVAGQDFAQVKRGEVLVRIDDEVYQAQVDEATANLGVANADLSNNQQAHAARMAGIESQVAATAGAQARLLRARADMQRANALVMDGAISTRERDQARADFSQAQAEVQQAGAQESIAREELRTVDVGREGLEAQVRVAQAKLRAAQIDLNHTVIQAPEDGVLGEVGVRLGQFVTHGTQLMSVVPADHWIVANYKEAQTKAIAPGQIATLRIDALGGATLKGHVERLSPATGSEFAVLKPDNATGNFVKVPQRIGVRISVDPDQPFESSLRPGMSVEVDVDTLHR